jgi:hypothetical protein
MNFRARIAAAARAALLSAALAAITAPATAEETREGSLRTTITGGYDLEAFDAIGGSERWQTAQTGTVGLTARSGNEFSLAARLEAPYADKPLAADDVIDELAVSWVPAPVVALTGGKQILKWGTARALSSIDRLAPPLDPLDPAKTRRGITGFRADVIPTWWLSASAVAVPPLRDGGYLDKTTLGLHAEVLAGETDLSFGAIRAVNEDGEEEPAIFADAARFFDRFGIYGESQLIFADEREISATGGAQIDIPAWLNGSITILGEYRYLSEDDAVAHQLYAGISGIPLTRRITTGVSVLAAPEQKTGVRARQAVLGADLEWKASQTVNASLSWKYLVDGEADDTPLVPIYTVNRQSVTASVSACY